MSTQTKVVIVGAGVAGIAAACRLIEEGFKNIIILEAKNRIGGRIHTVDFADNVVDLGAQWVHGESQNIGYNLASPHGLLESSHNLNDFEKHSFVNSKGELIPAEQASKVWKLYYEISDKASEELRNRNGSYGEYFVEEYYKHYKTDPFTDESRAEEILEWIHRFDNSIQCSDNWYDVSAKGITEYKSCDGDLLLNWKNRGYKTIFDLLMRKFPNSQKALPLMDKIEFGKEVSSIDYSSGSEVIVKTIEGQQFSAAHVIFTASLGFLKEQHSKIFIPPLPQKKQLSIKGLSIGVVAKIFLEFPHRWWPENSAGFGMLWSREDKLDFIATNGQNKSWLCDLFQFFTVDYQPRILCGWLVGQSARDMELLPEESVKNDVYELLEKFLGKTYNIPRPDHIVRTKWYSDRHFRGCYSYRSMAAEKLDVWAKDLAQPILDANIKPTLLFAGEATHDKYYSTAIKVPSLTKDHKLRCEWRTVAKSCDIPKKMDFTRELDSSSYEKTRLVIIGAGIAGLAAAKTLEDSNFKDYLLLEAQDQIGGRICSIEWNNNWVEAGAQFLHGDQSALGTLAKEHKLLSETESTEGQGIFVCDDGTSIDQRLVDEIDDLVCDTLENCEKYAYRDTELESLDNIGKVLRKNMLTYLRSKNETPIIRRIQEEIFDWMVKFLMIDNSCSTLDDLSTKYWGKFRFVGGPEHLVFEKGYCSLTNLLAERLDRRNLRLNSAVENIEWQRDLKDENLSPVVLSLNNKKRIIADCVIVTSSLGYLKENHRKMFLPVLPFEHFQAIESLGFGLINKIFLDFGKPWWETDTKGIQMLRSRNNDHEINYKTEDRLSSSWIWDLTGFDVLPNHDAVLLGWVGGQGASIVEKLTENEVANDCLYALKTFLKRDNIPHPKRCIRTRWNANKYVRGAYSHIPACCDEPKITPATLAAPIYRTRKNDDRPKQVPVLMFAGEATHEHFYSTTHGAYDTGKTQALNFLHHHIPE